MISEVRGIQPGTAFKAQIAHYAGLFYLPERFVPWQRDLSGRRTPRRGLPLPHRNHAGLIELIALDVYWMADGHAAQVPFGNVIQFDVTTDVHDYDGPVDLRLSVRGYSPKRPVTSLVSHVQVKPVKGTRTDRDPRAIRFTDDEDTDVAL